MYIVRYNQDQPADTYIAPEKFKKNIVVKGMIKWSFIQLSVLFDQPLSQSLKFIDLVEDGIWKHCT